MNKTKAALETEAIWEETDNEIRFRLRDPEWFRKDTFRRKELPGIEGVSVILGKLLPEHIPEGSDAESMVIQAYRFAKENWTLEAAKTWVDEHQVEAEVEALVAGVEGTMMNEETSDPNPGTDEAAVTVASKGTVIRMPQGKPETKRTPEALAADLLSGDRMRTQAFNATSFRLAAKAAPENEPAKIWFTLCHTGMNYNGDFFTHEELKAAVASVMGRKVDLSHWQGIADIVGQVMTAEYAEENGVGRIDCEAELFTTTYDLAKHAHVLAQRGILSNVSMECDFDEGECSVCHKRWDNWFDECSHQYYRGGSIAGLPVYRILHGVKFTGVGLLDRSGADEEAKISAVADKQRRETTMGKKVEDQAKTLKAKAAPEELMMDPTGKTPEELTQMVKDLQAALTAAETEIATLKQAAMDAEEAAKAETRKAEASKLLEEREAAGLAFASEEEKGAELASLLAMSDDQFSVAVTMQKRLLPEATASKGKKQATTAALSAGPLPIQVPDVKADDFGTRAKQLLTGSK